MSDVEDVVVLSSSHGMRSSGTPTADEEEVLLSDTSVVVVGVVASLWLAFVVAFSDTL